MRRIDKFNHFCVSVGPLMCLWEVLESIFSEDKMMNINGLVAWWPFLQQEAHSGVNDRRAPFREGPTIVRSPSLSLRLGHLMDAVFFMLGHVKMVDFHALTGGTGAEEIDMMLNLPEDGLAVPPFSFSL